MKNNTILQELKEKYPDFFKKIHPELLNYIFSKETSSKIGEICLKNGVEDEEKIEKIAYRITLILLNKAPKENLSVILEKGAGLNHETAKKISIEIKIFISPQIERIKSKDVQEKNQAKKDQLDKTTNPSFLKKKNALNNSSKKDAYRELIKE